jgi:hypothetical protein
VSGPNLEQRAALRGLASAHLARHRDEALALLDAIQDMGERLAVRRREKQKARIRGEREGLLAQTVERGIHRQATTDRSLTN